MPPNPDHYKKRISEIETELAEQPPTGRSTVLLGDSLTEAFPSASISGYRLLNQGIGGDEVRHSIGGLIRRLHLVSAFNPMHVFVMVGINDLIVSAKPVETISADQAELMVKLKQTLPNSTIHMQSVLPVRDTYARHVPAIEDVNQTLRRLSARFGVKYIDLFTGMADEQSQLRKEFSTDGVHLTPEAYKVWEDQLTSVLKD